MREDPEVRLLISWPHILSGWVWLVGDSCLSSVEQPGHSLDVSAPGMQPFRNAKLSAGVLNTVGGRETQTQPYVWADLVRAQGNGALEGLRGQIEALVVMLCVIEVQIDVAGVMKEA